MKRVITIVALAVAAVLPMQAQQKGDVAVESGTRAMILRMGNVLSIDATAVKNMEFILDSCREKNVRLILSHVHEQPMNVLKKAGFIKKLGEENLAENVDEAIELAAKTAEA